MSKYLSHAELGTKVCELEEENAALKEQVTQLKGDRDTWMENCRKQYLSAIDWAGKHQVTTEKLTSLQSKSATLVDALIKEHGNYVGKVSVGIGCSVCDLIDATLATFKGEK